MRDKSNVIKRSVEKVRGARYLPKNTVVVMDGFLVYTFILYYYTKRDGKHQNINVQWSVQLCVMHVFLLIIDKSA
jgi:hypothetical protein